MHEFKTRWLAAAILLVLLVRGALGQGSAWMGKQVIIRSPEVRPRIGAQAVDVGKEFRVYRVDLVQGEWLWVVSGDVRGWILAAEAMPYDQALEICTEENRTHPTAAGYTLRGNLWFDKTQYEIAIADFTEAIRLDPKYAEAYARRADVRLCRMLASIEFLEKQAESLITAGESNPHEVSIEKVVRQGVDPILEDYQKALRLNPRDPRAFLKSGIAWQLKREPDRALGCLNEAIRLDPKSSAAYIWRGRAWLHKEREEKALADFETALRLDPQNVEALEGRVAVDDSRGETDRLIADASALLKLKPDSVHAYILRGNAWSEKKQYAQARADYKKALEVDPGNEVARVNLSGLEENMASKQE